MAPLTTERRHSSSRWRGALFNALFYAWTIMLLPVCLATGLISRVALRTICRVWARGALSLLAVTVGLRYEVRGHGNLPDGPVMVAVKHQSAWETLALNLTVHDPAFVLKKELTQIPIFGWLLPHAGMIAVDRQGGAGALRSMVISARRAVADGRPVVIFPEGTRTSPLPSGRRRAVRCARRASRTGSAQFRPVLAAPRPAPETGPHHNRVSAGNSAGPAAARIHGKAREIHRDND